MRASQKWKIERILYIALIPVSYWFIVFFLNSYSNLNSLNILISDTFNKVLLLIFFIISLMHIKIQLTKVYEDYFSSTKVKFFSLLTTILIIFSFLIFLPVLFF